MKTDGSLDETAADAGPCRTSAQTVLPEWIDYNGHMNVAYYTLAFDRGIDEFLSRELGVGEEFVKAEKQGPYALQSHYHYMGELLEGERFFVQVRLLDHDQKRLHLFAQMIAEKNGGPVASLETMLMNVDLVARKSRAYPDRAIARFAALKALHDKLERPVAVGAPLALRRPPKR